MHAGILLLGLALVAASAAPAAAADRLLVPGTRIGPAALLDERAVVEAAIGPGVVVAERPGPTPALPGQVVRFAAAGLVGTFATPEASAPATVVATRDPRYRTRGGVHVGTTRAALRRALPAARCAPRRCDLVRVDAAGAVRLTRFRLVGGTVARIAIAHLPVGPIDGIA